MSDFLLKLTMDAVRKPIGTIHLGPKPLLQSQYFNGQFIKEGNGEHPVETMSREMVKDHEN